MKNPNFKPENYIGTPQGGGGTGYGNFSSSKPNSATQKIIDETKKQMEQLNKQGPRIPTNNNFSIPSIPKSYKGASLGNVNVNIINPAFTDPQQSRITTEQITSQFRNVMTGLA